MPRDLSGFFLSCTVLAVLATVPGRSDSRKAVHVPRLDCGPSLVTIMDIQGRTHTSPYEGRRVTAVGIVTATASNGFYMQDDVGDRDDATSDGIFVFTGDSPMGSAGDRVQVEGLVSEYLPGNDTDNLTITEIISPDVLVLSTGHRVPEPVVIGRGGREPPNIVIDDDEISHFDPTADGIDFYESIEGMLVHVPRPRVVGPSNRFGEFWVVGDGGIATTGSNARGGITVRKGDLNPERIQIDDHMLDGARRRARVGDRLDGITGVVAYSFGNYEVLPSFLPPVSPGHLARELTALGGDERLTVATFNVSNLHPGDPDRFAALASIIVHNLNGPDILGLQEIGDSNGPIDDGTIDAAETYCMLVEAIFAIGGPRYDYRDVDPEDGADGGLAGANIRVGLLFNPLRVRFIDRDRGTPDRATWVEVTDTGPLLGLSPGLVEPSDPAWQASRKPLAGVFEFRGHRIFVIVLHLRSRRGGSPLFGGVQPPHHGGEEQRVAQTRVVAGFVSDLLAVDPEASVVVMGDFNEFDFGRALTALGQLTNLAATLSESERYTFVFDGNSQALDHILVSDALVPDAEYDIVHVASEFDEAPSDHDPVVARLGIGKGPPLITALGHNHPNPFERTTVIPYSLRTRAHVSLRVFDVRGRLVVSLLDDVKDAGHQQVVWDGGDKAGRPVKTGVYFCVLRTGFDVHARKIIRIR